jgi:2-polyprenyl-3-methyl-5-hydroxy-6-metoxy-1,4-benzoquinol methylase
MENLARQGLKVYLVDNESTDTTVDIARNYANLIGMETYPREGVYRWRSILERKQELAFSLEADWFMHVDADERHLPPNGTKTLVQAIEEADRLGYSAIEFQEFTFIPTREAPDHDHPQFENTMRWYYHFAPRPLHLIRAWKKQATRVDLASAGGHHIVSPQLKIYPEPFRMKHYLFLSKEHAARKYIHRQFDESEVKEHWHGWRARLVSNAIQLPSEKLLEKSNSSNDLNRSKPWKRHWIDVSLELYNQFYIKDGYIPRDKPEYFSDVMTEHEGIIHQPDVYPLAAELGKEFHCTHIIDIGCGRGLKLASLHPKFQVIGLDYKDNILYCRSHYPFGQWIECDLEKDLTSFDESLLENSVIVCSDVIEHLVNPHTLLENISILMDKAKLAVISTPERDLVRGIDNMGPPMNQYHIREWNLSELQDLLQAHQLNIGFMGLTNNNNRDKQKKTTIALLKNNKSEYNLELLLDNLGLKNIFISAGPVEKNTFLQSIYRRVMM